MIRGLAALEVCLGHMRGFFLVDYGQTQGGLAAKIFYMLTGMHHQAVMIFFVLSGFLVGGSVVRAHQRESWNWSSYLLRRLCRLWIVIVPALLLTLFWDLFGTHLNPGAYAGAYYPQLLSGPTLGYDLSPRALIGNLFFLQTIAVPAFGSNGPLWSLANEFWYYMLFPLVLQVVLARQSLTARIVATALVAASACLLPVTILEYGLIWLFGVAAFLALDHRATARLVASWPVGAAAGLLLAGTLLASRAELWLGNDFLIGLAFTAMVPWLARAGAPSTLYRRVGFAISEFSYTLYVVHFPLLAFLYFRFVAPAQLPFGAGAIAVLAGVLLIVLVYAWAVWWLFERNTDSVRDFVGRQFGAFRAGAEPINDISR
jgi:peptidoglycan/LPS O-acetylase OafA/YrhL